MKKFTFQCCILSTLTALPLFADTVVTIDPGPPGSVWGHHFNAAGDIVTSDGSFDFFDLSGTPYNGQTITLDVRVANNEFLVSPDLAIEVTTPQNGALPQNGQLGGGPTFGITVRGQLLNNGQPVNPPTDYFNSGWMPAQVWPKAGNGNILIDPWPYFLPNGDRYAPRMLLFESGFSAGHSAFDHGLGGYFENPFTFDEILLHITLPNSPGDTVAGTRLELVPSQFAISVSPDHTPTYFVRVSDGAHSVMLLGLALIPIGFLQRRYC